MENAKLVEQMKIRTNSQKEKLKPPNNTCYYFVILIASISLIVNVVLLCGVYNYVVNIMIRKMTQLKPGTQIEQIWKTTPVPMVMRMYIFNLTNSEEFLKGQKPILKELGPYVYREYHLKENVRFHENASVTYHQKRWWIWDQNRSGNNTEDDVVIALNTIPITAAFSLQNNSIARWGLNALLLTLHEKAIVSTTASKLLFHGYEDPLLNVMSSHEELLPDSLKDYDKFGWFYTRNNSVTYDGLFNMNTGEKSIDDLGKINWWNYMNETKFYDSPCNNVKGSAGELWPPNAAVKKDFIQFYNSDLCMSPKLYYYENILDSFGISGLRFVGNAKTFAKYASDATDKKCFCVNGICGPSGLLNAQSCHMGAPAFVSFPYFLHADPQLLSQVDGLTRPDEHYHTFYIDVNQRLGIPLQVAVRLQINIHVQPYKGFGKITILNKVPDVIMPVIWFEVLSEMPEQLAQDIKVALFFTDSHIPYVVFALCSLLSLGIIIYAAWTIHNKVSRKISFVST